MADKTALLEQDNVADTAQIEPENASGDGTKDHRQDIFDARFALITDGFGKACEQEGIEIAIAIAIHPKEKHPIVFIRGHQYDVATLTASVLRQITKDLLAPLNPDPHYRE